MSFHSSEATITWGQEDMDSWFNGANYSQDLIKSTLLYAYEERQYSMYGGKSFLCVYVSCLRNFI